MRDDVDELERVYLTKREAAELAGCSTRTIERAIAAGELTAGGTAGLVRIHRLELVAWLARRRR